MKIKSIYLLISLLFSSLFCLAQTDSKADFEQALVTKVKGIRSISCDFTQIRYMSVLAKPVEKKGKFAYSYPGLLALKFSDGDDIILNGRKFQMTNNGYVTIMPKNRNPLIKQMDKIISSCITSDIKELYKGFNVSVLKNNEGYELTMNPKNRMARKYIKDIILSFDGKDMALDKMKILEPSGNYTEYIFYNKKFNLDIPKSIFNIK